MRRDDPSYFEKQRSEFAVNKSFLIVNSITYAIKSRDLLLKYGINAYIERSRKRRGEYGCGYGVYVPKRTDEAQQILEKHGVKILARTERDDGR